MGGDGRASDRPLEGPDAGRRTVGGSTAARQVLDLAVQLQDDRHVALGVVEEAAVADRPRTLVVARKREAAVAAELIEQPAEITDAGADVAVVGARRRRPEQDLVDPRPR